MQFIPQLVSQGGNIIKAGVDAVGGWGGVAQLGASALSSFSKYSSGLADQREYELMAARETFGATQEILRGRQGENEVLDQLLDTVAKQRVAFGAAGADPFIGTPGAVVTDSVHRGEAAGRTIMGNAVTGWTERRQKAEAYKQAGKAKKKVGTLDALAGIAGTIFDVLGRGSAGGGGGGSSGRTGSVSKVKTRKY